MPAYGAPIAGLSILALGVSEAAMFLRGSSAAEVTALISIHGQHESPPEVPAITRRLELRFDDVESLDPSDPERRYVVWARQKWSASMGRPLTPPTLHDAQGIIDFAQALIGTGGTLLCTCSGGVSRSTAAALICLATWTGPGHEAHCVEEVLRVRRCAVPLRSLVKYADQLLERNGRLIRAVDHARQRAIG